MCGKWQPGALGETGGDGADWLIMSVALEKRKILFMSLNRPWWGAWKASIQPAMSSHLRHLTWRNSHHMTGLVFSFSCGVITEELFQAGGKRCRARETETEINTREGGGHVWERNGLLGVQVESRTIPKRYFPALTQPEDLWLMGKQERKKRIPLLNSWENRDGGVGQEEVGEGRGSRILEWRAVIPHELLHY